jgi:hypothetical protein
MFRYGAIAPRRPARSRPELESLEARQVLSSLYPPDPCVEIAPAAVLEKHFPPSPVAPAAVLEKHYPTVPIAPAAVLEKHFPPEPIAPVTSVGVRLYPPSPIGSPSYRSAWSDGPVNDRPQVAYLIDPLPDPSPPPGGKGGIPLDPIRYGGPPHAGGGGK